ncbi:hypothetical protein VNO80_16493 [Phaseolus coccineus]|uniref:Uncharacterized protein n=1 Tax=Phaseolus coccineus TaxID=3886 RepID=A0AAN9MM89_PHACN
MENLNYRKADLAEGQTKEELREADFHINMDGNQKVKQFHLIKQLEREQPTNEKKSPSPATATKSAFNEIKDFQSHVQDGRGGGNPLEPKATARPVPEMGRGRRSGHVGLLHLTINIGMRFERLSLVGGQAFASKMYSCLRDVRSVDSSRCLVIVCSVTSKMIAGDDFNDCISSGLVQEEMFWSFW